MTQEVLLKTATSECGRIECLSSVSVNDVSSAFWLCLMELEQLPLLLPSPMTWERSNQFPSPYLTRHLNERKSLFSINLTLRKAIALLPSLISLSSLSIWFHNEVCDKLELMLVKDDDDDVPAVEDVSKLLSTSDESTNAALHISNCACKILPIYQNETDC